MTPIQKAEDTEIWITQYRKQANSHITDNQHNFSIVIWCMTHKNVSITKTAIDHWSTLSAPLKSLEIRPSTQTFKSKTFFVDYLLDWSVVYHTYDMMSVIMLAFRKIIGNDYCKSY